MEKSIVTTGKTIELAITAALNQLGMDRDSVSVEVLENARSGFLGIGASPAKVKVSYEVPDEPAPAPVPEAPRSALGSASRSKPKPSVDLPTQQTGVISRPGKKPEEMPKEAPRTERRNDNRPPRTERKPDGNRPYGNNSRENRPAERGEAPAQQRPARPNGNNPRNNNRTRSERKVRTPRPSLPTREYEVAAPGSVEEQIEQFLTGLLRHMGSDCVPHAYRIDEESYRADLIGNDVGMLIGRRGDTLDAIQYLTGYAVNRDRETRLRISVDAGSYRARREESLRQLAEKMAAKTVKYHRNFTLEPMNAYERHIVHAALQNTPGVTTFSTGTEPRRRVVIAVARENGESR